MKHIAGILFLWLFVSGVMLLPTAAEALVRTSDDILLFSPAAPGPNTETTASLSDSSLLSLGASVRWFVDGVEQTTDHDSLTTSFTTKGLGETTEVVAELSIPGSGIIRSSATVAPVRVDLLIGANSYVPSFYLGRALPGRSAEISARVHVFGDDSGPYRYYWRVGGTALNDSLAHNVVTFQPTLTSQVLVQVQVENTQGELVGEAKAVINLVQPEIHFYEVNPLHGLIPATLRSPYSLIKNELTIRAEPYFVSGSPKNFALEWSVDNGGVAGDDNDPLELTLEKALDNGEAIVKLQLINRDGYLERADSALKIQY